MEIHNSRCLPLQPAHQSDARSTQRGKQHDWVTLGNCFALHAEPHLKVRMEVQSERRRQWMCAELDLVITAFLLTWQKINSADTIEVKLLSLNVFERWLAHIHLEIWNSLCSPLSLNLNCKWESVLRDIKNVWEFKENGGKLDHSQLIIFYCGAAFRVNHLRGYSLRFQLATPRNSKLQITAHINIKTHWPSL